MLTDKNKENNMKRYCSLLHMKEKDLNAVLNVSSITQKSKTKRIVEQDESNVENIEPTEKVLFQFLLFKIIF